MLTGGLPARFACAFVRVQSTFSVALLRRGILVPKVKVQVRNFVSQPEKKTTIRSLRETKATDFDGKGYILLVVPLTAFILGTWQVQRRKWKIGVIEELERRTTAKPVPLPHDLSELEDYEYRRVTVTGHFDHSKELHVSPRALIGGNESSSDALGVTGNDQRMQRAMESFNKSGSNVVTAFVVDSPEHHNTRILVNRGWVPRDKVDPAKRPEGQIQGTIELSGVVRLTEPRQQFSPANEPERNQWFTRDINAMAEELGTVPVFIDADKKSTVPGGPVGGQTIVTLRNEHMSYIITWYSLAGFTFLMWFKRYMVK